MKSSDSIADSPEWRLLLTCARGWARHTPAEQFQISDPERLLSLAEEHSVTNFLACCLQDFGANIPPDLLKVLQARQRQNAIAALALVAEMLRVTELLNAAGIESLVLKGPALSLQAYGDPALRQYADIDLLVRHRGIYAATELLQRSGYTPRVPLTAIARDKVPGEYVFRRDNGVLIEIHTERTLRYFPNRLLIEDLFARKVWLELNGRKFATQSFEDALLGMCTHGAKHFWERLLWVADLDSMLLRNASLIDWKDTLASARALGAERILRTGVLLANRVLATPIPAEIAQWLRQDRQAVRMAERLAITLPNPGSSRPGLFRRAIFRIRMRGGLLAGLRYLTRLTLLPTEHDWESDSARPGGRIRESSRRLLRLAAKYGRGNSER